MSHIATLSRYLYLQYKHTNPGDRYSTRYCTASISWNAITRSIPMKMLMKLIFTEDEKLRVKEAIWFDVVFTIYSSLLYLLTAKYLFLGATS